MSKKTVCIIDYGLGNVNSVRNALQFLNVESVISHDPIIIQESSHLILPGVGSFGHGISNLKKMNLVELITHEVLVKKKNILGICLGMQLFATKGFENGEEQGLGFVKGNVVKIDTSASHLRLPQIGWNNVSIVNNKIITKAMDDPIFYFVHSYCLVPDDMNIVAGVCDYGEKIVAIIESANIFGTQFHPEKSYTDGLGLLRNFLNT